MITVLPSVRGFQTGELQKTFFAKFCRLPNQLMIYIHPIYTVQVFFFCIHIFLLGLSLILAFTYFYQILLMGIRYAYIAVRLQNICWNHHDCEVTI